MQPLIVAASVMLSVAGTAAQGLSSADIAAAIEQGRAGKTLEKKCSAQSENGFDIVIEGPIGRIMRGARDAKRQHREFTADDATMAGGPWLTVAAKRDSTLSVGNIVTPTPNLPGIWGVAPETSSANHTRTMFTGFEHRLDVAIRSRKSGSDTPVVLRPEGRIVNTREAGGGDWVWASGPSRVGPLPGSDMVASFDLASFRNLPAGKVEVVIFMTDAGEHRCGLSEKDRRKLR